MNDQMPLPATYQLTERQIRFLLDGHNHDGVNSAFIHNLALASTSVSLGTTPGSASGSGSYPSTPGGSQGGTLGSADVAALTPTITSVTVGADSVNGSYADVTWSQPTTGGFELIQGYNFLVLQENGGFPYYFSLTGNSQPFRLTQLPDNTKCTVQVQAFFANGGVTPYSPTYEFTTGHDTTPPAQVVGVNAIAGYTSVTVTWTMNSDYNMKNYKGTYQVDCATDTGFTNIVQSVTVSGTVATFNGLTTGTNYYIRVWAISATGIKSLTASATFGPVTPGLAQAQYQAGDGNAPSGSSPTPTVTGGPGYLFVTWSPMVNNDIATYEVYVGTSSSFVPDTANRTNYAGSALVNNKGAASAGPPQFFVQTINGTALSYNTNYYVRIYARDVDGYATGGYSVAVGPTQLTQLTIDNVTGTITANTVISATINANAINTGTLNASQVNVINLNAAAISTGTIGANIIYAGTIAATQITAGTLNSAVIYSGTITANQISTGIMDATNVAIKNSLVMGAVVSGTPVGGFIQSRNYTPSSNNTSLNAGSLSSNSIVGFTPGTGWSLGTNASGAATLDIASGSIYGTNIYGALISTYKPGQNTNNHIELSSDLYSGAHRLRFYSGRSDETGHGSIRCDPSTGYLVISSAGFNGLPGGVDYLGYYHIFNSTNNVGTNNVIYFDSIDNGASSQPHSRIFFGAASGPGFGSVCLKGLGAIGSTNQNTLQVRTGNDVAWAKLQVGHLDVFADSGGAADGTISCAALIVNGQSVTGSGGGSNAVIYNTSPGGGTHSIYCSDIYNPNNVPINAYVTNAQNAASANTANSANSASTATSSNYLGFQFSMPGFNYNYASQYAPMLSSGGYSSMHFSPNIISIIQAGGSSTNMSQYSDLACFGVVTYTSSIETKKNIDAWHLNATKVLEDIVIYSFDYKDGKGSQYGKRWGPMWDYVPDQIKKPTVSGTKALDELQMISFLLKTCQELNDRIHALEGKPRRRHTIDAIFR